MLRSVPSVRGYSAVVTATTPCFHCGRQSVPHLCFLTTVLCAL
jgi:hypothetical protein